MIRAVSAMLAVASVLSGLLVAVVMLWCVGSTQLDAEETCKLLLESDALSIPETNALLRTAAIPVQLTGAKSPSGESLDNWAGMAEGLFLGPAQQVLYGVGLLVAFLGIANGALWLCFGMRKRSRPRAGGTVPV